MDLKDYLENKGLSVTQVGNNLQSDCPFCDDDRQRFGVNNNNNHAYYGYWNCLNGGCGVKGRSIGSLQKEFNKLNDEDERAKIEIKKPSNDDNEDNDIDQTLAAKYYNKISNSKRKAKEYLIQERGFSTNTIKHFMLGSWKKKGYEYVALPFWENGELVNIKFRAIKFKDKSYKWRRITGGKSSLYHDEVLDNQEIKEIFLCHPKGNNVITEGGWKDISEVSVKDKVWSHNGKLKDVIRVGNREVNEEIVKIKPMYIPKEYTLTKDHPVYTSRINNCNFESWKLKCKPNCPRRDRYSTLECQEDFKRGFKKAGDLDKNDFLPLPIPESKYVEFGDKFLPYDMNYKEAKKFSKKFWYFIGLFLGDGTVAKNNIITIYCNNTDNHRDSETVEFLKKFLGEDFKTNFKEEVHGNVKRIYFYHHGLSYFLRDFYKDKIKYIPEKYISIDKDSQLQLIKGLWQADGHIDKNKNGDQLRISNTSIELLHSCQRIFMKFGFLPSINLSRKGGEYNIEGRTGKCKQLYNLSLGNKGSKLLGYNVKREGRETSPRYFFKDNYCFIPIAILSTENYSGTVYNIEVEDDNSYLSPNIVFHNCEAELDAIALWNAGFKNVVAVTTGAKAMQPEWYDRLERFERINLVFDNDVDGQDGAEKMAKRLGMNRCHNIVIPQEDIKEDGKKKVLKDANQYFWDKDTKKERYTAKDFKKLVKQSKQFQVKAVISLTEAYRELIKLRHTADDDELVGYITRWERINKILPRSKPGYFVVVTANPKVGKTTWVMDWFTDLSKQGTPTYIECCEMRQLRMAEKTIANALPDFTHVDNLTELQIRQARFQNPSDIMYLGYPEDGVIELEAMCEKITNVVQRYGVKAVCFDHLHFLVRGENVRDKIGEVTRRFKLLAEQLGILFVLIAQPRKVENNRVPTANDLKDSSSIYQDLDSLVILHRRIKMDDSYGDDDASESNAKMESVCEVHVTSRWGDGGSTLLNFNGRKAKYFDSGLSYDNAVSKFREKYGFGKSSKRKRNRK